ncbi:MAG: NUDIX domain-containing protein [Pseudomonadota bacterium]
MSFSEDAFFAEIAARGAPRLRVAGLVLHDGAVLTQQAADDPAGYHALIGGEVEAGDALAGRLAQEFQEETDAALLDCRYLLCVENRFLWNGAAIHQIEHVFAATLDRVDIRSREAHLAFRWLPLGGIAQADLRPRVLRDALADGSWRTARHLVEPLP